jgi:4-amino-4-deoxy-L-arabinose transferase-like glycosyltransferase
MKRYISMLVVLTLMAIGFRLYLVLRNPNDDDDDGKFYSQIARNLLEHRGYSGESEEPFVPTYVRTPGYPIFVAAIYYAFGEGNDRAVRVAQAVADTATCWLIALLALLWSPAEWNLKRRRRTMLIALALAAVCPFTAIYTATMLTETLATMFVTAFAVVTTLALKSKHLPGAFWLWLTAGVIGGIATMCRPDCALFAGGAGVFLSATGLRSFVDAKSSLDRTQRSTRVAMLFVTPIALTFGFAAALAPWTIRNARVFGVFQPVAPQYANMPNEFAPYGYIKWLRTWVDGERYVSPFEDAIDLYPIHAEAMPDSAFDSPEERDRVAALLEHYNNPAKPEPQEEDDESEPAPSVKMTAEIDAAFMQIADDRIARHPLRYYIVLPLKRAVSLWFDTHSQYYPFQGRLFPLDELDTDAHQQYWLPLFALVTGIYTTLALIGVWLMWMSKTSRQWVWLLALLIVPRLAFLAAQEHPEPRYTVEYFAFAAAAGALALAGSKLRLITKESAR